MTIIESISGIKNVALAALLSLAIGIGVGYWVMPTKTVTQTVEKIVEKKVAVDDRTVTERVITRPDGTTEKETIKKDVTTRDETTTKDTAKTETTKAPAATADQYRPNYSIGAAAQAGVDNITKPSYNVSAGYRLFGNLWGEAMFNTGHREVAAGLRVEF